MPQITTRPFTFNYSFHQCIKNTLTHTLNSTTRSATRALFIRFSHCVSFILFLFFHLSQAQQIAFARSSKLLLWLSMSCAHNHVYRIYHVSFSTLPSVSLPLPFRYFYMSVLYMYFSVSLSVSSSLHSNHSSTLSVDFIVVYALQFTFVTLMSNDLNDGIAICECTLLEEKENGGFSCFFLNHLHNMLL